MTTIKAIETRYAGCRFRSRLEARWAVFLDTLSIVWEYEPQGFEVGPLPTGHPFREMVAELDPVDCKEAVEEPDVDYGAYLPDFHLPDLGLWFEVKGEEPDHWGKLCRFGALLAEPEHFIVAIGAIPDPATIDAHGQHRDWNSGEPDGFDMHFTSEYTINGFAWCSCPWCKKLSIAHRANGTKICGQESGPCQWQGQEVIGTGDDQRLIAAYAAARSARFEHGEHG